MLFAINCTDKENARELRAATRPDHLAYLNRIVARLALAGPILIADEPAGSLIVIEAETLADAEAFAANDPYTLAGLFATVSVQNFRVVFQDGKQVA
jgi:hypothetical protein